ncbi:MAG: simple sugar transport system substrate-binding protein [Clostridiales bacterium]|jgi:simple sugar transport system substrate-binding protein|nr:simple sugar transport system substrate-binding protein [Clostridiales bacterium]MDK2934219.1 simple sugar transport system substrate-binding protein [Clostridiales bacterium]
MKKLLSLFIVVCLVMTLVILPGCGKSADESKTTQESKSTQENKTSKGDKSAKTKKYKIATVPKVSNIAWFDRMEEGVKEFAKDTGHDAFQVGPQKADAALQVQIIEDLIAQKVDAITVVPFSTEALEPVLKKARDKGIVVISHEASSLQNIDYDIEAFDNAAYGAHFMEHLAKLMGEEGEYATFVGSLTSKTHNEWVDAAIKLQKEKYPKMKLVAEKQESYDDQKTAYEKTRELLKAHPNLKGIQGSAMGDAPGAALAIEEMGLTGKVHVVGTSLVSVAGKYLESGSCDLIGFWDPAKAGYAMNQLAVMVLEGKEIKDGLNLGIPGYENLKLKDKVFYGQAWVDVTKENMNEYDF